MSDSTRNSTSNIFSIGRLVGEGRFEISIHGCKVLMIFIIFMSKYFHPKFKDCSFYWCHTCIFQFSRIFCNAKRVDGCLEKFALWWGVEQYCLCMQEYLKNALMLLLVNHHLCSVDVCHNVMFSGEKNTYTCNT